MVEATCHRCGREWDYTGRSDHYGTCPNCKTSVRLHGGSERAEPSETAERCPDPSDRTTGTVEVRAGAEEPEEMPVVEAVEALDESVTELYELGEARGDTVADVARDSDEREERLADLRAGLEEVAGYFEEFIEANGGEVDYAEIDVGATVPAALEDVDMEGFEA
jgi:hypothetical protein